MRHTALGGWLAAAALVGLSVPAVGAAQPALRELAVIPGVEGSYPSWAPTPDTVAFHVEAEDRRGIYQVALDGSGLRRLTRASDETPFWSPDGGRLVFRRNLSGNGEIFLLSRSGGEPRNLTRDPATDFHPRFSPDGGRILFESNRSGADNFEIYEMGLDGTAPRRLTRDPAWDTYSSYSPDGARIVWRRAALDESGERNSEVWVMERDGSDPRNLTRHAAFDGWPDWSPEGGWIAFASNRGAGGAFHVWVMRPDGSGLRRLTPEGDGGGSFTRPIWSPDGRSIVCTRSRDGREEIAVLHLDRMSG